MLCQDCKKREANRHITQIINNEKTTLNLCQQCAAARGFHSPLDDASFPLADILSGMKTSLTGADEPDEADKVACPSCGLTFHMFTRQGRFGCGECYKVFRTRLEPIMRKIHGASLHRGNPPVAVAEDPDQEQTIPVREEERLQAELSKAIDSEDFERAAEIRDKLKAIRAVTPESK